MAKLHRSTSKKVQKMNWFNKLYRKFEVKFLGKKYCSMTSAHGHDMEFLYIGKNCSDKWYNWSMYECSVCKQRFILDSTGFSKASYEKYRK